MVFKRVDIRLERKVDHRVPLVGDNVISYTSMLAYDFNSTAYTRDPLVYFLS